MEFLADDGHFLIDDTPSRFSSRFDWIVTETTILKRKRVPKSIFVKTDYLSRFLLHDFPTLTCPFVLITGSSDWSPSVNFPYEYKVLLGSDLVTRWYMLNCLDVHPKVFAYPGGLCHNEISDEILMDVRDESVKQSDKILCIWRGRTSNVCGDQFVTRSSVESFVKQHPDIFDWVDVSLSVPDFYRLLATYKFVLCPLGNGVDPCPKAFESMIVKTVPIMLRTRNTELYAEFPAMVVDDFESLLSLRNLGEIYEQYRPRLEDDTLLYELSCEYWYRKIMKM